MKLSRRKLLHLGAGAALPTVLRTARAQSYPTRPVRIVSGYPPGGVNDIYARLIGQWLSERMGQQFIVENRAGAGGTLAADMVVRAAPDGCTLLLFAKVNPGTLTVASAGIGSAPHMFWELFRSLTGVNMLHVPYRGGGPALTDLLGGQVLVYFGTTASTIEYVRARKVRALAVTSATRTPALPDIPPLAQFVPGYEASIFVGVTAPRDTAAEIVRALNHEINLGLADARVTKRIAEFGDTPLPLSPQEFGALITEETEKWRKVVKSAGIRAE
jgi:tripartite-type tricarboxylate transporter receptor subunit TctC